MECKNHPGVQAVDRCAGCAEAFCPDCLVDIQGRKYCGACKVMAVQGQPMIEEATIPCKEAKDALIMSIIGLFCFGFILGPIAIVKSLKAKKMIEANPRLSGSGQATAALIIGIIGTVFGFLGLIIQIARLSNM
jgi:hypothetical protein